MTEILIRKF